jgi:single-stranded-DNA-specific exonuclease
MVDGFTSSSIFINYFNDNLKEKYPNVEIKYHIPEAKAHGLSTIMNEFTNGKICDLIVCPDSSSNDFEEHQILKDLGYDILVEDHHLTTHYSENAVVINNQLSENYPNKELSGVGVVYKFLQYCDEQFNLGNAADKYLDLVALGIRVLC